MSNLRADPAKNRSMRARFGLKKQTDAVPSHQNEALEEVSESRTQSLNSPQAHAQTVLARSASSVDADSIDIAEVSASPAHARMKGFVRASSGPIEGKHASSSSVTNFWQRAYSALLNSKDTESLMKDYERVLDQARIAGTQNSNDPDCEYPDPDIVMQSQRDKSIVEKPSLGSKQNEMERLAKERLEEMQKRQWIIRWKGKDVFRIREQVTRLVGLIQQCSGLASAAVNFDPLHAGIAWAGICVILPLIISDTEERGKAVDGLNSLAFITARYERVERRYTSGSLPTAPKFEEALLELYKAILLFYAKSACYFAKRTYKIFLHNLVKLEDWTGSLAAVSKADQDCKDFTGILSHEAIDQNLQQLLLSNKQEKTRRVLSWLSHVEVGKQHDLVRSQLERYPSAGSWFLQSSAFESWNSGVLWLRGAVGTGKTSICSKVIDILRRGKETIAFFYCTELIEREKLEARTDLLRSLVAQLALSPNTDHVAEEVTNLFEEQDHLGVAGSRITHLQAQDLFCQLINSHDLTTIVLDALDECPGYQEMLKELSDLANRAPRVRFFMTSQFVVSVEQYFSGATTVTIEPDSSKYDMLTFITREIEHFESLWPGFITGKLCKEMIETLSHRSEGMFKWAQLCLKYVLDPTDEPDTDDIQKSWDAIKSPSAQGVLADMVSMYDKLYEKSLPLQKQRRLTEDAKVKKLLLWVLHAKRPISMTEANALCHTNGSIPRSCRAFVQETPTRMLQIVHSSARDYLSLKLGGMVQDLAILISDETEATTQAQQKLLDLANKVSSQRAHFQIAKDSLDCIMCVGSQTWTEEVLKSTSLLSYASEYWIHHAKRSSDSAGPAIELLPAMISLFDPKDMGIFRNWVNHSGLLFYRVDSFFYPISLEMLNSQKLSRSPLFFALGLGFADLADALLSDPAIVEDDRLSLGLELELVCFQGHIELFQKLVLKVYDINDTKGNFGSALQAAAAGPSVRIVASLVNDYGAKVDTKGGLLGSPLQAALARGSHDVVDILVKHGAKFDSRGHSIWNEAFEVSGCAERVVKTLKSVFKIGYPAGSTGGLTNAQFVLAFVVKQSETMMHTDWQGLSSPHCSSSGRQSDGQWQQQVLTKVLQRMQQDDIHEIGFSAARLCWALLARCLDITLRFPKSDARLETIVDLLYDIENHDKFLAMRPQGQNKEAALHSIEAIIRSALLQLYKLILRKHELALVGSPYFRIWVISRRGQGLEVIAEMRRLNGQVKDLKRSYVAEETRLQQQEEALSHRDDISLLKDTVGELKGEIASLRTMIQALLKHQGIKL